MEFEKDRLTQIARANASLNDGKVDINDIENIIFDIFSRRRRIVYGFR